MKQVILRPKAIRFIKKADTPLKEKIKTELRALAKTPLQNPKLSPPLAPLRSHHFKHQGTDYRMAYLIEGDVIVVLIGTRENFYKGL